MSSGPTVSQPPSRSTSPRPLPSPSSHPTPSERSPDPPSHDMVASPPRRSPPISPRRISSSRSTTPQPTGLVSSSSSTSSTSPARSTSEEQSEPIGREEGVATSTGVILSRKHPKGKGKGVDRWALIAGNLTCPLCVPSNRSLIHLPRSLSCGHVVCAAHLLPDPAASHAPPGLPSTSASSAFPPPHRQRCPIPSCSSSLSSVPSRSDVVVAKIISLVQDEQLERLSADPRPPALSISTAPPLLAPSAVIEPDDSPASSDTELDLKLEPTPSYNSQQSQLHDPSTDSIERPTSSTSPISPTFRHHSPKRVCRSKDPSPSRSHSPSSQTIASIPIFPPFDEPASSRSTQLSQSQPPSRSSSPLPWTFGDSKALSRAVSTNTRQPDALKRSMQRARRRKRDAELTNLLECDVCALTLYEPVTTACGHTFCRRCLARSRDHSQKCPLCRCDLPSLATQPGEAEGQRAQRKMNVNQALQSILVDAFPDQTAERRAGVEQNERDERMDTAIFVCNLAFPYMPTILHVFEPRYRLMLRRCIESNNPRFGMILPLRGDGPEYGTMLEIRSIQTLQDGRSMVETVGSWRFKVLEKGGIDGYTVGRVERIDDISPEEEASRESAALEREPSADSANLDSNSPVFHDLDHPERSSSTASPSASPPSSSSFPTSFQDVDPDGSIPSQHTSIPTSAPMLRPPTSSTPASASDSSSSPSAPNPTDSEHQQTDPSPSTASTFTPDPTSLTCPPKRNPADLSTDDLMEICEAFIEHLRSGSAPWLLQRLNNTYGPMPEEPTVCSYWMASVIPIDEYEKAKLLPIRSPRLRLALIVHWIEQLQGSWWFSSGCVCS